jgi:aspartyl/glutamyl-tRNA(Asn/Gln) amidotransferase C subunit
MSNIPSIKTLAALANLPLEEGRANRLESQLASVAELMDDVRNLNLEHTASTNYIIEETNVFRSDEVQLSFTQDQAISQAKKIHQGYIVVPPVLTKEESR